MNAIDLLIADHNRVRGLFSRFKSAQDGVQEHHVVKLLMAELGQIPVVDDEWTAKMVVLIENVEHHAEEEEKELFPTLRAKLAAARLDDLAEQMEARKAELGAPVLAEKIDLTKEELVQLAQAQDIPGRSSMSQEELAATVSPK